jgi:hypothetical protein
MQGPSRDSVIWWLGILGAALAYLGAAPSPVEWSYGQWIQAISAIVATISGKLATSPLRGDRDARSWGDTE